MSYEPPIQLTRDCDVIQIPGGEKLRLTAGSTVRVSQALGGTYTLITDWGAMVRIDDRDADAIGKTPGQNIVETPVAASAQQMESHVWEQLKTCYDPEIPVNMVDLGLVYVCRATATDSGKFQVEVQFTLTAPGCGMGDILRSDIERKVQSLPGVEGVKVDVTFEPPWDRSMMSEAARLQLGF